MQRRILECTISPRKRRFDEWKCSEEQKGFRVFFSFVCAPSTQNNQRFLFHRISIVSGFFADENHTAYFDNLQSSKTDASSFTKDKLIVNNQHNDQYSKFFFPSIKQTASTAVSSCWKEPSALKKIPILSVSFFLRIDAKPCRMIENTCAVT